MKRSFAEDPEEDTSVNLTPLIDIVFVILMTFMIAVPMVRLDSIALASGNAQKKLETEEHTATVIKVFANHTITLNDRTLSLNELASQLALVHKHHPEHIPLLLQDGETPFKLYQQVKTAIESAGFHELHVALQN